jgi:hypothetical protein
MARFLFLGPSEVRAVWPNVSDVIWLTSDKEEQSRIITKFPYMACICVCFWRIQQKIDDY